MSSQPMIGKLHVIATWERANKDKLIEGNNLSERNSEIFNINQVYQK